MRRVAIRTRRIGGVLWGVLLLAGLALPFPARAQNSSVGQWGSVMSWPESAIHAQLLPTGKVMFGARSSVNYVWDPSSGSVGTLALNSYSVFCTGHSFLADGKLLVTGGHVANGIGLPYASLYDPFTNGWTRLPNLSAARWYPTNVTLGDGSVLTLSGSMASEGDLNDLPQVLQTNGAWRNLTNARLTVPLYPNCFLAPNGKVFVAGPGTVSRYLDTNGSGAWSTVANRSIFRDYGPAVLYETGKVLFLGGGDPPNASAEVIDLNAANPSWRGVSAMSVARRHANATILPDGKVLVTGGVYGGGFNNTGTPIYSSELWDPATEKFTLVASQSQPRWYHSAALLLPDGRVLTAGGEDTKTAQVYSPPYLFKGARPTISSAPGSVGYGQSFFVGTSQATSISQVTWLRLGSVTHTNDMNQRINRLAFSQASGGLNVSAPGSTNLAPPGHYMLFLVDQNGVPSVARILQIGGTSPTPTPTPTPTPPTTGSPPAAPASLKAVVASGSQVNLTWLDNSSDEDGFAVDRAKDGEPWIPVGTVGRNVTSYASTNLEPQTTYWFRVLATKGTLYSEFAPAVVVTTGTGPAPPTPTPTPTTPPTAPSNLTASTVSSGQINLAWSDNDGQEDGFTLERSTNGTSFSPITTVGPSVTSYADAGLNASTLYYYRVAAIKGALKSAYSNTAQATTAAIVATAPPTPTQLTATTVSTTQIRVAWASSTAFKDGFKIERSLDGLNFSQIALVGANETSYLSAGLTQGVVYYYRVRSYVGPSNSSYSNIAAASTSPGVPGRYVPPSGNGNP